MNLAKNLGIVIVLFLSFLTQVNGQTGSISGQLELLTERLKILSERAISDPVDIGKPSINAIQSMLSKGATRENGKDSFVNPVTIDTKASVKKNPYTLDSQIKEFIKMITNLDLLTDGLIKSDKLKGDDAKYIKGEIKKMLEEAKSLKKENDEDINVEEGKKLAERIGGLKPMTAVLFTSLDRNRFEVVKDSDNTNMDPATGIINQKTSGNTAGILLAMEAPFAYPRIDKMRIPIGGWFGLNLTNGQDDTFENFNLAAGLSFILVSKERIEAMEKDTNFSIVDAARLLVGVTYGNATKLGQGLEAGNEFPLGEEPHVQKEGKFKVAVGLGFRF